MLLESPWHAERIEEVCNVRVKDMVSLFDLVDESSTNRIDLDEFLSAFHWINEPVKGKSLLKLESAMKQRTQLLQDRMQALHRQLLHLQTMQEDQSAVMEQTLVEAQARFEDLAKARLLEAEALEAEIEEHREVCQRLDAVCAVSHRSADEPTRQTSPLPPAHSPCFGSEASEDEHPAREPSPRPSLLKSLAARLRGSSASPDRTARTA